MLVTFASLPRGVAKQERRRGKAEPGGSCAWQFSGWSKDLGADNTPYGLCVAGERRKSGTRGRNAFGQPSECPFDINSMYSVPRGISRLSRDAGHKPTGQWVWR